jgi:branched-chain amino acid transport system permease protein
MKAKFYTKWILYLLMSLLLIVTPWVTPSYMTYLINLAGIYSIAILGLNILMGIGGQVWFGGIAMMAIGAYAAGFLANDLSLPFYISILLSGFITSILSLIITFPALRVKGLYLAMVSVGFHLILEQIITGWESFTGGYVGLSLPKATLAGIRIDSDKYFYYIVLITVFLCIWSARNIMKMRVGRAIWAIGQELVAASVYGINITFYKVVAFMICAFYCGISGGLLAHYLRYISPDHFTIIMAIMVLVGMIIGGWGSVIGSIAGGFFVIFLPEVISLFKDIFLGAATALYDLQAAISGIIIIIVVIFIPNGVAEWLKEIKLKLEYRYEQRGK